MQDNFSYCVPTKIVYGVNSLQDIEQYIKGRKTLLITSEGFIKRGLLNTLSTYTGNIVEVISEVQSHPEFKDLKKTYEKIASYNFELILAIGGGSVLDASKFFSVHNEKKEYQFVEDIIKGKLPKRGYKTIPIISVATTAGTGSEITPWATIWDMDEKKKYSLHLPELFSEVALYDPTLTLSVPKEITVQTGLDTLSHALESIWNKNASPITVGYAVKSAKLIMDNLLPLSNNLTNIHYRDNIMKACMYAGLAFSNTQTAIAHAMSYYITAHKGIDHGIACSFTLPLLIDNVIGKHDFIDEAITEIYGTLSSERLRKMLAQLDVSTEFSDYGISEQELIELMESLQGSQRAGNSLVRVDSYGY